MLPTLLVNVTVALSSLAFASDHQVRAVTNPGPGPAGFTLMTAEDTGLRFTNRLAQARYVTNQIHLNGSGVALGDVDGDGWCDIFLAGLDGPNALFRNLGGWRFTNVTDTAGVAMTGLDCTGAALADVDGDGDLDLMVNTIGSGTHVLLNDGRGRYSPAPGSPWNLGRGGMSVALADTDGDGDLDAFIANYRTDTFRDQPGTRFRGRNVGGRMVLQTVNGRPITEPDLVGRYTIHPSGAVEEHGEANLFLRNEGGGRYTPLPVLGDLFRDPSGQPLTESPYDWTLAAMFRDLNGDGAPDLYLCNDFGSPDILWLNDGRGRFRQASSRALRHIPMFSMGVDVADLNGDGHADFIVADMLGRTHADRQKLVGDARVQESQEESDAQPQYSFNQLFLGQGDGEFVEVGWFAGVTATDWTWGPIFLDVDLDGHEDLIFCTGHELRMMDADIGEEAERRRRTGRLPPAEIQRLKLLYPRHAIPNVALRNLGNLRFEDATERWRFGWRGVSTGMALADLDNDGDLDVVLNNLNDPALILRNDAPGPRLLVRLRGLPPNTHGIGATITVHGGPTVQTQEIIAGGRYLSSDDPARAFATGAATNLAIEVRWRSGRVTRISDAQPNRLHVIHEPESESTSESSSTAGIAEATQRDDKAASDVTRPLFRDASPELTHQHRAAVFDDFALQPLLPHRLSAFGPGVLWADLDEDGDVDLVIGSDRGARPGLFRNEGGHLKAWDAPAPVVEGDQRGLVAWPKSEGGAAVLVATDSGESGSTNTQPLFLLSPGEEMTALSDSEVGSPGPLATADIDGDGDLDLFVGGRSLPGRYPEARPSHLFLNENGVLRESDDASLLKNLGWVSSATWADLDRDGFAELIVACDWGSIRIFQNDRGRLRPGDFGITFASDSLGIVGATVRRLAEFTGRWTGIAAVDLDEDGRLDLVAGNWGRNSPWELAGDHPLQLYFGDYDGNGSLELIEAVQVAELRGDAPLRSLQPLAAALPFIRQVAPTHEAYSRLTVRRLLGSQWSATRNVSAAVRASVALLNRGGSFEVRALPMEAQWAPVFAVVPGDFDGDGHEDVFLGQNFFRLRPDAVRQDAGRGLLLRGKGDGGFEAMPGRRSGIVIHGEQRGAATADFDADARPDLVVTEHGGVTRLYRNVGARRGIRVRLQGPKLNPWGVGAVMRLRMGSRVGPARMVDGGSGWLSQSSAVNVLGAPERATELEVLWPGGAVTRTPVPEGAVEIMARP